MSFNPKVSSYIFESQSYSKQPAESSGNLQGRQVSTSSSFSDAPEKASAKASDILGLNPQEKSMNSIQNECTLFQMDWVALEKRDENLPWYDKGPFIYISKHYDIYVYGFNRKRLFDLLEEFGPYIISLNFIDKPADATRQFSPFLLENKGEWIELFQLCPNLDLIKTKELPLLYKLLNDPDILKKINQKRKHPIHCPVTIPELCGESVYLPTFSVGDIRQMNDLWIKRKLSEVVFPRLSDEIWEKVAEFCNSTALKTLITTLTITNKNTSAHTLELIQKMKALLLSKEHGLSNIKVESLIQQCAAHITKLNLKGLRFNKDELKAIVELSSKLREIELNKFYEGSLFELFQEYGRYVMTLDFSKYELRHLTVEQIKTIISNCPHLIKLDLRNRKFSDNDLSDNDIQDILLCCRNIIKLYLNYNSTLFGTINSGYIPSIPSSLKVLSLEQIELTEKLIGQLPKGLTHLVICLNPLNVSSNALTRFPFLETLDIEVAGEIPGSQYKLYPTYKAMGKDTVIKSRSDFINELIKTLPTDLKELNLRSSCIYQLDLSQLPKSLQKLSLELFLSMFVKEPVFVQNNRGAVLSSLISVKINTISSLYDNVDMPRILNFDDIQALPQTLKSLSIYADHNLSAYILPRGLEELNLLDTGIFFPYIFSFLKTSNLDGLPLGLKKLTLITDKIDFSFFDCDLSEVFPSRSKQLKIAYVITVLTRTNRGVQPVSSIGRRKSNLVIDWAKKNNIGLFDLNDDRDPDLTDIFVEWLGVSLRDFRNPS